MALSTITFMNKTCIVYEGVKNVKIMRLEEVTNGEHAEAGFL